MEEIAERDGGRRISAVTFAANGKEALYQARRPRRHPIDVILIDLVMPARPSEGQRIVAPWIARALSRAEPGAEHPGPPALILWTSNPMKKMGCETHAFIHLGGHQVIDKEDAPEQQLAQLRVFSNPDQRPKWEPPSADGLTPRRRDVLPYLETDMTFKEIGEALFIEERSVESAVERIREALGWVGRREVISAAKDAGWTWVPLRFLADPFLVEPGDDPFSLAR